MLLNRNTHNGPCTYFRTLGFLFWEYGWRGLKRQKWRFIYTQRKSRVFANAARPRVCAEVYIYLFTLYILYTTAIQYWYIYVLCIYKIYITDRFRTFRSFRYEIQHTHYTYTYINIYSIFIKPPPQPGSRTIYTPLMSGILYGHVVFPRKAYTPCACERVVGMYISVGYGWVEHRREWQAGDGRVRPHARGQRWLRKI